MTGQSPSIITPLSRSASLSMCQPDGGRRPSQAEDKSHVVIEKSSPDIRAHSLSFRLSLRGARDKIRGEISSATAEKFVYEPLRTHQKDIRLLKLFSGSSKAILKGELQHFDLDSPGLPKFNAVSYVWGRPKFVCKISLQGKILNITESIHTALVYFISLHHPVWIWADAICIDQKNLTERGSQVQIMGQIYSTADTVPIWLGPDEKGLAQDTVTLLQRFKSLGQDVPTTIARRDEKLLEALFSSKWFSRLWIMQEAILAQKPIFFWGLTQIPWELISTTSNYVHKRLILRPPMHLQSSVVPLLENLRKKRHDTGSRLEVRVTTLSQDMRTQSCSDDRDRVYAILGLARLEGGELAGIKADYTKSVDEVYLDLMKAVLESSYSLQPLQFVSHGRSLSSWKPRRRPSWVPYWNLEAPLIPPYSKYSTALGLEMKTHHSQRFLRRNAHQQSVAAALFDGFIYTTVKRHRPAGCDDFTNWSPGEAVSKLWHKIVKPSNADLPFEINMVELITRFHNVLVFGNLDFGRPGPRVGQSPEVSSDLGLEVFLNFCQIARNKMRPSARTCIASLDEMISALHAALENIE